MRVVFLLALASLLQACMGITQTAEVYSLDGQPMSVYVSQCRFDGHYIRVVKVDSEETLGCVDKRFQPVSVYEKKERK